MDRQTLWFPVDETQGEILMRDLRLGRPLSKLVHQRRFPLEACEGHLAAFRTLCPRMLMVHAVEIDHP